MTSSGQGGTARWMSPELLDSERFGGEGRPTRSSDCYALGMTVYEVLTGQIPFPQYNQHAAVVRVTEGMRPERPQGAVGEWFTDDVWGILGRCWEADPSDRPSIEDVLQHLDEAKISWTPLSHPLEEGPQKSDSSSWTISEPTF